jgi:hypothetical protein
VRSAKSVQAGLNFGAVECIVDSRRVGQKLMAERQRLLNQAMDLGTDRDVLLAKQRRGKTG